MPGRFRAGCEAPHAGPSCCAARPDSATAPSRPTGAIRAGYHVVGLSGVITHRRRECVLDDCRAAPENGGRDAGAAGISPGARAAARGSSGRSRAGWGWHADWLEQPASAGCAGAQRACATGGGGTRAACAACRLSPGARPGRPRFGEGRGVLPAICADHGGRGARAGVLADRAGRRARGAARRGVDAEARGGGAAAARLRGAPLRGVRSGRRLPARAAGGARRRDGRRGRGPWIVAFARGGRRAARVAGRLRWWSPGGAPAVRRRDRDGERGARAGRGTCERCA
jgi:hypothetical protein